MDIIVDIDGTIADCRHRRHFIHNEENKKDWNAFYNEMGIDAPIKSVLEIVKTLSYENRIIFCTGRPKKYYPETYDWINKHTQNLLHHRMHFLIMRKDNDYRPDYEVKEEMLEFLKYLDIHPRLVFEDKQECVDMWRRNGIITLQNSMKELP